MKYIPVLMVSEESLWPVTADEEADEENTGVLGVFDTREEAASAAKATPFFVTRESLVDEPERLRWFRIFEVEAT